MWVIIYFMLFLSLKVLIGSLFEDLVKDLGLHPTLFPP